jgi:hypothetical protein
MSSNGLLQEQVAIAASFDAFAVINVLQATNEAADMRKFEKASFIMQTDDTYIDTDADLTIQLFKVAIQAVTGGTLMTGKAVTIAGAVGAGVLTAQVDVRDDELGDGFRFVYAEVVAAGATQTAVVSVIGLGGGIKNGIASDNGLTVSRVY